MTKACERCGRLIGDSDLFCDGCGARQSLRPIPPVQPVEKPPPEITFPERPVPSAVPASETVRPLESAKSANPVAETAPVQAETSFVPSLSIKWPRSSGIRAFAIFVLAFVLRILYLEYVTPLDWNWDSYHHWQIAYYTLNLGLVHGRMWDLMGSEYQWPPLPILTGSFLIWVFGTSILSMRILNMLLGSGAAALAYFGGKRWNENIGLLAGVGVAIAPVIAFTDVLGLSESMMLFFAMLGFLMVCRNHSFYAGVSFGLASLCHFFAYPLFLILIAWELTKREGSGFVPAFVGYGVVMVPYTYELYVQTGNPLYTFALLTSPTYGLEIKEIYMATGAVMLILAAIGLVHMLRKHKLQAILFFSFGVLTFYGVYLLLVTPPVAGAERYYVMISAFAAFLLAYYLDALKTRYRGVRFAYLLLIVLIISAGLTVIFAPRFISYQGEINDFYRVADWLGPRYQGGVILSEMPVITYRLIDYWNIPGYADILGAHYCPTQLAARTAWLQQHNVTWIIWTSADFDFTNRVFPELADGQTHQPFVVEQHFGNIFVYAVNQTAL